MSKSKPMIEGEGAMPFDMNLDGVQVRLEQNETKIVLKMESDNYAAELDFPIHYPNGTPDEMADRESELRKQIQVMRDSIRASEDASREAEKPFRRLCEALDLVEVPLTEKLQGWCFLGTDHSIYLRHVLDHSSREICKGKFDKVGVYPDHYSRSWRIADETLLKALNAYADSLGKKVESQDELQKSLQEALGERDLYKSQLESLHAKYEALVARNAKLLGNRDAAIQHLVLSSNAAANARKYLENKF